MEVPSAIYTDCPECGEETLHSVLKGTVGAKKSLTLDATVRCETCTRVHHVVVREARNEDVAVVISTGRESRKTRMQLSEDETLSVGDDLIVDGTHTRVTALEMKDGRRVTQATPDKLMTIWVKDFESIPVKFSVNLGKKTISKVIEMAPTDLIEVGQEFTFNRLRVTVHGIKVERRMLRRGDAEAQEIQRVFGKPSRLDRESRVFESAREGARIARQQRAWARPTDEEVLAELPDWEEDEDGDEGADLEFEENVEEPTGRPRRNE